MSYYANGYGDFRVNEVTEEIVSELNKVINKFKEETSSTTVDFSIESGWLTITYYEDYEEDIVIKLCVALANLDFYGNFEFHGEDSDDCWRIVIKNGNCYYCEGRIVYDEPSRKTLMTAYYPADDEEE